MLPPKQAGVSYRGSRPAYGHPRRSGLLTQYGRTCEGQHSKDATVRQTMGTNFEAIFVGTFRLMW